MTRESVGTYDSLSRGRNTHPAGTTARALVRSEEEDFGATYSIRGRFITDLRPISVNKEAARERSHKHTEVLRDVQRKTKWKRIFSQRLPCCPLQHFRGEGDASCDQRLTAGGFGRQEGQAEGIWWRTQKCRRGVVDDVQRILVSTSKANEILKAAKAKRRSKACFATRT